MDDLPGPGVLSCLAVHSGAKPVVPSVQLRCSACDCPIWVSVPWSRRVEAADPVIRPHCERCAQLYVRRRRDAGDVPEIVLPTGAERAQLEEHMSGAEVERLARMYGRRLLFGPTLP